VKEKNQCAYRRGDAGCLVLDVRLPGMSGPELQSYLRREALEIPIVFVSAHGDVPTAVNAIKGGAVDFIQKPFDYREALAIVRRAFERDVQERERHARRAQLAERLAALTERERGVLQRMIEGKANKVIAAELDISVKTVEAHRAKVMEKMAVDSVAELVQRMAGVPPSSGPRATSMRWKAGKSRVCDARPMRKSARARVRCSPVARGSNSRRESARRA